MKKKGFTLIELLGVIIVLAIIALIAVPTILGVIDKAKKGSLKDSAYGLIEAANLYYAQYGVSNTERFNLEEENELKYKGKVESGTVLLNSKGKVMICINDNGNAVYKNYNDNEVVVISGKTCNVNTSETQILLDGENTIDEYTNQELTDLVNSLQEQIEELEKQINEGNTTNNSNIEDLTTKHNEDINKINNKIGTEDLTAISDGSISQILIDNNELVKNLQTITNNLSTQLSNLSGTVNNHTTQISSLTTSLNGKANSSHTHSWDSITSKPSAYSNSPVGKTVVYEGVTTSQSFTAPADGYFWAEHIGGYTAIVDYTTGLNSGSECADSGGNYCTAWIPVRKGDTVQIWFNDTIRVFKFINLN